ncbi:MAG: hypothetical protein M0Z41_17050 [Peptococcaceae bacterium]|nr:hypothetical protein [Peptococcaceae bacterium]
MRFVIMGNSAAGVSPAELLRRLGGTGEITIVSDGMSQKYVDRSAG